MALQAAQYTYQKQLLTWSILLIALVGVCVCARPNPVGQTSRQATDTLGKDKPYSSDKQLIAKGQSLFQTNCSACHNFRQKGIGPNLAGVTTAVTPTWLRAFVRNAPEQISRGDARAVRLFEEYKQYMPAFPALSDPDLEAILAFVHTNQKQRLPEAKNENLGAAIDDPVPAKIAKSGLRLRIEDVLTAPATAQAKPLARINKMLVLPGQPDRVFIEDLRGKLYELIADSLRTVMDLAKERPNFIHTPGLATGFGSYAFHPDFYRNGLFYTTHTEKAGTAPTDFAYADSIKVTLQWVITEWKITDPTSAVFTGTGRELFRVNMVSPIHGVQEITFNPLARPRSPDYGLLYIGVGDGGATENGYPFLCHDKSHVWGSVMRIDPKGTNSRNGRYGIPATNPYAKDKPTTVKEIYCRGFRNPNRICWTPNGNMLITDIGQARMEEINIGIAGADYGWPEREGTYLMNSRGNMGKVYALPANDKSAHYVYPVAQYDHDEGNAISGGFVYTGTATPQLQGKYIFGDVVNGRIFYVESNALTLGRQAVVQEIELEHAGKPTTFQELSDSKKTDLRMGMGLHGDLFLYTKSDGKMYRVAAVRANP
ncbi:PQQ-dependent sugar dehydrogenase [Fibrella sp. HMF5335]|uniref:PQQ-dependent sugar dehydrogenase n=2 Tax=Fibrella rubiginis TaxID=2817060 RepID=A0A939GAM2_9BACT|nr:PQQ-dependent sugar dehydrogenase [Fibrella rubiginis]